MPQPSDLNAAFRAGLASGLVPAFVTAHDPTEATRRFAVYRNNVAHSLRQALARRFPVIERLVGHEFFVAMAGAFISAYPPRSPVLQEWGGEFIPFLTSFAPAASLPYLPDVARIEWARGLAYHAADARPISPDALTEDTPLRLHPSVQILRLDHPAVAIWAANQPGQAGRASVNGPQVALIWRRADWAVEVVAQSPDDALFIENLMAGLTLAQAADGCDDPTPCLTLLLREGLICEEEIIG